jgi:hypothetical protein
MNNSEPLGLKKGSIRAILALTALGATVGIYLCLGYAPEWLITITAMSFAWYFKSRENGDVA